MLVLYARSCARMCIRERIHTGPCIELSGVSACAYFLPGPGRGAPYLRRDPQPRRCGHHMTLTPELGGGGHKFGAPSRFGPTYQVNQSFGRCRRVPAAPCVNLGRAASIQPTAKGGDQWDPMQQTAGPRLLTEPWNGTDRNTCLGTMDQGGRLTMRIRRRHVPSCPSCACPALLAEYNITNRRGM